jgi:DNA-binding response OmpR family regulator
MTSIFNYMLHPSWALVARNYRAQAFRKMEGAPFCWRLLLELRGQDTGNDTPAIVASSTGEVRKAVHLGADDYMAKPVDRERLLNALDRHGSALDHARPVGGRRWQVSMIAFNCIGSRTGNGRQV